MHQRPWNGANFRSMAAACLLLVSSGPVCADFLCGFGPPTDTDKLLRGIKDDLGNIYRVYCIKNSYFEGKLHFAGEPDDKFIPFGRCIYQFGVNQFFIIQVQQIGMDDVFSRIVWANLEPNPKDRPTFDTLLADTKRQSVNGMKESAADWEKRLRDKAVADGLNARFYVQTFDKMGKSQGQKVESYDKGTFKGALSVTDDQATQFYASSSLVQPEPAMFQPPNYGSQGAGEESTFNPVPEPSGLALFGMGLLGLLAGHCCDRRRRSA
jgi:hypothetical protein